MFFYVPKEKQNNLLKSLDSLVHVPFSFEEKGSSIIFNEEKKYE